MMTNLLHGAHVANKLFSTIARLRLLLVMFLTLTVSAEVWGATWSHSFTSTESGGTKNWDNTSWTLTVNGGTTSTYDNDKGAHYGTNNNTCTSVSFTTSNIPGTISSIDIEASRGSSLVGTLSVSVGGQAYTLSSGNNSLTTTNTKYTFTGNKSGDIAIVWNKSSGKGAFYIKSISVTYEEATSVAVSEVSLDQTTLSLEVGETSTLTATISPNNATNKTVTWSTSDANIATVSNGKVTAIAEGSATITVKTTDGNKTATCKVTVNPKPKHTVNWYVNGTKEHSQTDIAGTALTGIPVPTTLDCDGEREFVGWTTQSSYEHATNAPTDLITNTSGLTMPENGKDYYAVFATRRDDSGSLEEVFYTNTGKEGTDQTTSIVASGNINTNNGNGETNCIGLTSATNKTFTFSNINTSNYSTVTLQFDHKIGKYTNYPTLTISCGDFEKTIQGSTGKYITAIYDDFPIGKNLTLTFTISAASGNNYSQTYLDNISLIGYKATTTYSNYTTQCTTEPTVCVIPKCGGDGGGTWLVVIEWFATF